MSSFQPQPDSASAGSARDPEDEEIERLADQIEAAWDVNPDADIHPMLRASQPSLRNLPRSLPYWLAGGIAAVAHAVWPVVNVANEIAIAGLVPLLLFVLAAAGYVVGTIWVQIPGSGWGSRSVGLLGLMLMTVWPAVLGLHGTLSGPFGTSPLALLADLSFGLRPALWALGMLALYVSWLMATRRAATAYATVPILGLGVLLLQWVFSLMGLFSPWGQPYDLARPALQFYRDCCAGPGQLDESGFFWTGAEYFVFARAIEVVGVLLCLRFATVLEKRTVLAREAAVTQASLRTETPAHNVSRSSTAMAERTNTLAILSLVFAFVFPLIGVILGHVARSQIRRTGEQGAGLTFAALIIGYVALGAVLLILIISASIALASRSF